MPSRSYFRTSDFRLRCLRRGVPACSDQGWFQERDNKVIVITEAYPEFKHELVGRKAKPAGKTVWIERQAELLCPQQVAKRGAGSHLRNGKARSVAFFQKKRS